MDQATADKIAATLERLEQKVDEVLKFRDLVVSFAGAGAARSGVPLRIGVPGAT